MPSNLPPLSGLVVLDLGQIYQGPYAAFLMAQAGANVIKVEPPGGEPLRQREQIGEAASFPLAFLNSNKRGITLNLKSERGPQLLGALAERADVLIENFSPGVLERLGVGPEVLMARNPRLIYASGTGFGLSGPDRDRLAMDPTVQAAAGVMSITGLPDGPPLRAGPAIGDFLGGTHLFGAVCAALFERERTGRGRLVEVAMQEAIYPTLVSDLGLKHRSGEQEARRGNRHGGVAPYNVYSTRDGWIALLCVTEGHWRGLISAMGRSDLDRDPRFATNAVRAEHVDAVDAVVEAWARELGRDEAVELAQRYGVPCAAVRDLMEVEGDSHMHQRGMLQRLDHRDLGEVVLPRSPLRFWGAAVADLEPHPRLGEHNHQVYGDWLGLADEELERLQETGVI